MGEVRLVDLEIIKRYSLAIRQETAPAEDVLAVLDASRAIVAAAVDAAVKDAAVKTAVEADGGVKKPQRARRTTKKATRG